MFAAAKQKKSFSKIYKMMTLSDLTSGNFGLMMRHRNNFLSIREEFEHDRTRDFRHGIQVIRIVGPPLTNKTRLASCDATFIIHGNQLTGGRPWFNGYDRARDTAILIDEIDSRKVNINLLKQICDGYPMRLEIKGSFSSAGWKRVYLVSNEEDWFTHLPQVHIDAFKSRIDIDINMFTDEIIEYPGRSLHHQPVKVTKMNGDWLVAARYLGINIPDDGFDKEAERKAELEDQDFNFIERRARRESRRIKYLKIAEQRAAAAAAAEEVRAAVEDAVSAVDFSQHSSINAEEGASAVAAATASTSQKEDEEEDLDVEEEEAVYQQEETSQDEEAEEEEEEEEEEEVEVEEAEEYDEEEEEEEAEEDDEHGHNTVVVNEK